MRTPIHRRIPSLTLALFAAPSVALAASSCLDRPIDRATPRTTSTVVERITLSGVPKLDVLLVVDGSGSMADKQEVLANALPDLVDRLLNPSCVDGEGLPSPTQPASSLDDCPAGTERAFASVTDMNIGVISSNLGALGATQCDGAPEPPLHPNDRAHLLRRGPGGQEVPTHESRGYLAWDPKGERGGIQSRDELVARLRDLVIGVGQLGCGYEMPLEAMQRFLVDPAPYDRLVREGGRVRREGVDEALLEQRRAFLRPDSLVTVLLLSDENDCSVAVEGQGFLALDPGPFYRSTAACAIDPNDRCCTTCFGGAELDGCPSAPENGCAVERYTLTEDPVNLRCFQQKSRYGVDFLYPTQRYVNALSAEAIDPTQLDLAVRSGEGVPNPLYEGASATGARRNTSMVFVAGIVGVPWQAVARRDASGEPDLALGLRSYHELLDSDAFPALVGRPDTSLYPSDPFMRESVAKRSGASPLVGASLPGANPVNGGDRTIVGEDDLQYTCIFPLSSSVPTGADCAACTDASCDNPLCQGTTQTHAKAYPGLRPLSVLEGLGAQGITASICPAEQGDASAADYGYRPAIGAIVERLARVLVSDPCLPRALDPNDEGQVACLLLEASREPCDCESLPGRRTPSQANRGAVDAVNEDPYAGQGWACICEIEQLGGTELEACQRELDVPQGIDGWCYLDATRTPQLGDPALLSHCAPNERRMLRLVNGGEVREDTTTFITCSGR